MLRAFMLALSFAGATMITAPLARAEAPAAVAATYPLPPDAKAPEVVKGGGGRIRTYKVPRGRAAVVTEARAALAAGKWQIVKDEASPSGSATRIQAKRGGALWKASYTGDDNATVIIVTAP